MQAKTVCAWAILCLTALLTGCQPQTVVQYQYPPTSYLAPCTLDYGKRTAVDVITGLSAGLECERADKLAVLEWINTHKGDNP